MHVHIYEATRVIMQYLPFTIAYQQILSFVLQYSFYACGIGFVFKYNTYNAINTTQIYLIDRIYLYGTFTYKQVNTIILGYSDYLFYHRWTHFPLGCCNIKLAVL